MKTRANEDERDNKTNDDTGEKGKLIRLGVWAEKRKRFTKVG